MKTYNWKRNTVIFLASQAISIFGSSLVQYAITWHITLTTQSGVYATLAIVFGILPTFFLAPFAGVWADRYNRKRLIVMADAGIALATLALAVCWMLGYNAIWLLFAALAVRGLGSAIQNPCVSAMLPEMVPEQHLIKVNGINSSVQSLITLVSPMLSAALIGFAPLQYIFFIDVVTALLAIGVLVLFFRLPQQKLAQAAAGTGYFSELKQGFLYIGRQPYLRNLIIFICVFCFMAAPVAFLTPLQVTRNYGGDVWHLSAIEIAFSIGMTIGGLAIAAWGGLKNRAHTMVVAVLVMAVCTAGLSLDIPLWLYVIFMGSFGLAMPIMNTPAVVMLQEQVDPAYLGRVFGVVTMVNTSMMPLGMLLFGPMADVIAIEWILLATGAVILLGTLALAVNKPILKAGAKRKENAQQAA